MTLTNDRCNIASTGSSTVLTTVIDRRTNPDQALSLLETCENAGQLRRISERQSEALPIGQYL